MLDSKLTFRPHVEQLIKKLQYRLAVMLSCPIKWRFYWQSIGVIKIKIEPKGEWSSVQ